MYFFTKMEKFETEHSLKNIPVPSQRQYKKQKLKLRGSLENFQAITIIIKHLIFFLLIKYCIFFVIFGSYIIYT